MEQQTTDDPEGIEIQDTMVDLSGVLVYQMLVDEERSVVSLEGNIQEFSAQNYSRAEQEGLSALIHPDDRDFVLQHVEQASAHGQTYDIEYRLVTSDNSIRNVHEKGKPVPPDNQRGPTVEGIILDRTSSNEEKPSDRKEPQTTLQNSKKPLQQLGELSGEIFWQFTKNFEELLFVNDRQYRKIWGRDPDKLREEPQDFLNGVHPDDIEQTMDAMDKVMDGEIQNFQVRVNPEKDFQNWVQVEGIPVYDDGDNIIRITGTITDISDRKEREKKIQDREAKYRSLFEDSRDALMLLSEKGFYDCNERTLDMFGIESVDEFVTCKPWDLSPATQPDGTESEKKAKRHVKTAFETGEAFFEWTHKRTDGTEFPAEVKLSRFSHQGETAIHAHVRNITDRKQAQKALRENEERFRQMAENIEEVFFLTNPDGTEVLYMSPAYEDIWGRTPEQLRGHPIDWLEFVHEDDQKHVKEEFENNYATENHDVQYRIVQPDGEIRWIRTQTFPVTGEEGQVQRVAGIVDDITELREVRLATEAKSQFLAQMSHDIRTPMNAIIGMADMLNDSSLTSDQSHHVDVIQEAGDSLLTLINNILDLSKIEAEELPIAEKPFSPRRLIESIGSLSAQMASEKGLEITIDVGSNIPVGLNGDENRIRQILMNLVGNAIENTSEGVIILRARYPELQDGVLHLSVEDTGSGISEKNQKLIFEDYQKTRRVSARQTEQAGSGLGLTICRKLLDLMGGEISVESEEGVGSTFSLTLPLESVPLESVPSEDRPEDKEVSVTDPELDLSDKQILLIDDNDTNLAILSDILQEWGASIESAGDGRKALELLRKKSDPEAAFDLILTDDKMPVKNGFEFVRAVKEEMGFEEQIFAMLTSSDAPDRAEEADEIGLAGYLIKPVSRYDLARIMQGIDESVKSVTKVNPDTATKNELKICSTRTILIAEDNKQNRDVVKAYLQSQAVDLRFAKNGREAVEYFRNNPDEIDFVLMDMKMPKLDGYAATKEIRQWEEHQGHDGVPIVALTAQAMSKDRNKCIDAGCDEYLSKPIKRNKLFSILETFLGSEKTVEDDIPKNNSVDQTNEDVIRTDEPIERSNPLENVDDILVELLPEFLSDSKNDLESIQDALADRDFDTLATVAHGLKGAAQNYGLAELAEVARRIEVQAEEREPLESLSREGNRLERELDYLQGVILNHGEE